MNNEMIYRSTYIQSQGVCAIVEAQAMQAANDNHYPSKDEKPYKYEDFMALIDKYGISHNAVITYMNGAR